MSKRKSIVSAFGDIRSTEGARSPDATDMPADDKPKTNRVAAGIIGTTQRTLTQIREERDALLDQVANSSRVVELEPSLIDASPFRDRLPDDDDSEFESFKTSIFEEGQKVPITVRRHGDAQDRFQVVYGHRRLRALKMLERPVLAIIADYSDRDLVIAQGIENANRQDLSWIEKALFAEEMQSAGIKPKDIKAALGIDDAEVSKLRSVLKGIPKPTIEMIGRAPSIGRPRWLELAASIKGRSDLSKIEKTLSADKVLKMTSDERFLAALVSLTAAGSTRAPHKQASLDLGEVGSMTVGAKSVKISLEKKHSEGFSKFLETEIGELVERYKRSLLE